MKTSGLRAAVLVVSGLTAVSSTQAQLAVRPDDPLGLSPRVGRVQVLHSADARVPGTSMALQRRDPWLAYALGRDYFEHEWSLGDGVFRRVSQRPIAGSVNSCGLCHNLPFRAPGHGGNAPDPVGFGRNTPHLFGVGLLETLAIQIRAQILERYDLNRNGFLDHPEETARRHAIIQAAPDRELDFGALDDRDGDGRPDLNPVIRTWMVDGDGRTVPAVDGIEPSLDDARVRGYDFSVAFLSSSVSDHQLPSVRTFTIGVMETIMGLPSIDPTVANDSGTGRDRKAGDGWSEISNAGAPQPAFQLRPEMSSCARLDHVSEGELDLFEWYLMNHPAPGHGRMDASAKRGRRLMQRFGCLSCHVPTWTILPADDARGLPGDRRFFDLDVAYNPRTDRLEGKLRDLTELRRTEAGFERVPRRAGATVDDVFTDLRHHDVGSRFYEYSFAEGHLLVVKRFRTPALWGVGSSAPYGHDGRSATLDDVIRRHGGEAADARGAYVSASDAKRRDLLAYLSSLVLYQPDTLPSDLDGDARISDHFVREGNDLGPERFWPELLFNVVPRYRGWTEARDGERYFSFALSNTDRAYARDSRGLLDRNRDGIPDVLDEVGCAGAPRIPNGDNSSMERSKQ